MPYVFHIAHTNAPTDFVCTEQYFRDHSLSGVKYLSRNKVRKHKVTWYLKPTLLFWSDDGKFDNKKLLEILHGQGSDKRGCVSKYVIISPLINENVIEKAGYIVNMTFGMWCYYYMTFGGRKLATPNVMYKDKNNKVVFYDDSVVAKTDTPIQ